MTKYAGQQKVASSRRKSHKAHWNADSKTKRKMMSAPLSKELRQQHGITAMPIHKDDEVTVTRGSNKGREGKVTAVYRLKWAVHVERITREKTNGQSIPIPLAASKLMITKLKLDPGREKVIDKKAKGREEKKKALEKESS